MKKNFCAHGLLPQLNTSGDRLHPTLFSSITSTVLNPALDAQLMPKCIYSTNIVDGLFVLVPGTVSNNTIVKKSPNLHGTSNLVREIKYLQ